MDRRGFDPADIANGEALLTENATMFPPEDLKLLANRVVDGIDPDGTVPDDQLNDDRRYFHLRSTRDGAYVGDFRLTGTAGAKLQDPARTRWRNPGSIAGGESTAGPTGSGCHDALEDLCDRQLRAGDIPDAGGIPATVIVTIDADDLINRHRLRPHRRRHPHPDREAAADGQQRRHHPTVLTASGAVWTWAGAGGSPAGPIPGVDRPRRRLLVSRLRAPPNTANDITSGMDRRRTDEPQQSDFGLRYHHHNFLARGWTCRINPDGIPEWTHPIGSTATRNP